MFIKVKLLAYIPEIMIAGQSNKAKQLTNIRASGTDENLILVPHIEHSLEQALEFIEEDELVEVTPSAIRLRKKL